MGLPIINYEPSSTPILLNFKRGPQNFLPYFDARVHDNLSTSGLRERVTESVDLMISFDMGAVRIGDDYQEWASFYAYALNGGSFTFQPNSDRDADYFDCVTDDMKFVPTRKAPGVYAIKCLFRVIPGGTGTPADPGAVMKMFYNLP